MFQLADEDRVMQYFTLSGLIFARNQYRGEKILDFSRRLNFADWKFYISRRLYFAEIAKILENHEST